MGFVDNSTENKDSMDKRRFEHPFINTDVANELLEKLNNVNDLKQLDELRVEYLSKKGKITAKKAGTATITAANFTGTWQGNSPSSFAPASLLT